MSIAIRTETEQWQLKAACRGPQARVFFREGRAKAICRTCSVKKDCLDYAVRIREQHGIWGGLSESERKPLLQ